MSTFRLQYLRDARDNIVDPEMAQDYTWAEIVELFSQHEHGEKDGLAFIAASFLTPEEGAEPATAKGEVIRGSVGRKKCNVSAISCITLDYDGEFTIEQAREAMQGMQHVAYTSHSHMKDGVTQKFRVLIPLAEACPVVEWESRRANLREFFPCIDSSTFDTARLFYTPRVAADRAAVAQTWSADGIAFDWRMLEKSKEQVVPYTPIVTDHGGEYRRAVLEQVACCNFDEYKDWLALGGRLFNAGFDLLDYQGISRLEARKECASWWKTLSRNAPTGMGPLIKRIREEFPGWSPPAQPVRLDFVKGEHKEAEPREEVTLDQREFQALSTSKQRRENVRDFVKSFMRGFSNHGVLRTPEGYGKSTEIVAELMRQYEDVLFCCLSHKQVAEKMADFERYEPVRVWSTSALIKDRLGIEPVMKKQGKDKWGDPGYDREATVEMIAAERGWSLKEAEFEVSELAAISAESKASTSRLLITTFVMGDIMFRMNHGRTDRVVVVDDPSMSDLMLFKYEFPSTENEKQTLDEPDFAGPVVVAQREVHEVIFGKQFAFQDRVIWTTTEKLVLECLRKNHAEPYVVDVTENLDTGANILALPTHLVRKATKKVLPGITRCVEDSVEHDILFIANGTMGELNLVNTKGRNDLSKDTVIALSYPHPCDVAAVTATLGCDPQDPFERIGVLSQMVTDVADQAIGRSQAYRSTGHRVLILIEPKLEAAFKTRSRYRINGLEGLKRRGRLHGVPLEWHVEFPDWWAAHQAYLDTWSKHVVVLGDKVYESFSLTCVGFAKEEQRLVEARLKKPPAHVDLMWKLTQEVVSGDGKRNFSEKLRVLVSTLNTDRRESGNTRAVHKFVNPHDMTAKPIRCTADNVPPGWVRAPGRQPTGKPRGRPRRVS